MPRPEMICDICHQAPCACEKDERAACEDCGEQPCVCELEPLTECPVCGNLSGVCSRKIKVKLKDGKELSIQHMTQTMFWDTSGRPISS